MKNRTKGKNHRNKKENLMKNEEAFKLKKTY